jgi:16S rRNA (adenine(1408)-N(1))-methyltransferase
METIRGKRSLEMTPTEFGQRLAGYKHILLDLGTGDGRFVCRMAEQRPDWFFIGIDACRENLHLHSRKNQTNALFLIANAQAMPLELNGLASHVTINFPWGSLLESLLLENNDLIGRLKTVTRPRARLDIYLNGEALAKANWTLESGAHQIDRLLNVDGWRTQSHSCMDTDLLRSFPTTWAKRLAFGRDPRAIQLSLQRE